MSLRISVVIPALNEAACIERAVASAWAAAVDEVVVVDGRSHDATVALAESSGARVITGARGRAIQQNLGASESSGDVLLFLHADNWLAPSVGQQIRECLSASEVLGGALLQRIEATGFLYRLLERGNAARVRWRGLAYGDQAIFMRKGVFQKLGGFPPVELMEDLLLMRKFRKTSRPVLLPGPVFVDPRRWQRKGVLRQTFCNWALLGAHTLGVAPERLARYYPPHVDPRV
ncbi:MAG: glycosyltransferase family 2 protein [Planctomycetes bacterium]|nr:glycosyltransferase family 2 protein [Planctomycetota bacterium]